MADARPKYTTVARAKNYWMSTQALSIMLNALGEPNRIQASAASGARFFCHFEDIGDADALLPVCSGDMLFNVFNEYLGFLRE